MLDDILGRSELRERISTLESERDRLEKRLSAETERRKSAVRDRQTADEQVNRLEDRIVELEDRVTRLQAGEPQLDYRGVETLRGDRCRQILDCLESVRTNDEAALTAFIDDDIPEDVRNQFGDHTELIARAAPCLICTDDAGMVSGAFTIPMAPEPFLTWANQFEFDRSWFLPTGSFAFALVRSNLFALGEFQGDTRLEITTFETDVQSKHSKGGFSQARFERRRDDQIETHLDRCLEVIDDRSISNLIVVGERTVLSHFSDVAETTATVGATGDPKSALDSAFHEFWTTRLYLI